MTAGHEEIEDVVTTLTDQLDEVDELLTESETDTFSVLSLLLETNYADQIHQLRELQAKRGGGVAEVADDSIDELVDRLRKIDVARQYFN